MEVSDRIVREPERKIITGISSSNAWRYEREGTFPKRIRIRANSVGWRLSELLAWVESRQICTSENTKQVAPGVKRGRKTKIQKEEFVLTFEHRPEGGKNGND